MREEASDRSFLLVGFGNCLSTEQRPNSLGGVVGLVLNYFGRSEKTPNTLRLLEESFLFVCNGLEDRFLTENRSE